jgi:hypothetical protein
MESYEDAKAYLDSLPEDSRAFAFREVRSAIMPAANSLTDRGEEVGPELSAELAALAFVEDYPQEHWGTYYGPMFVLPNEEGQMVEYPSVNALTASAIEYWERRAGEVSHPCLRQRYADIVWDLSEQVSGNRPDYRVAHLVIESTVEASTKRLAKHDTLTIKQLKRALDLSLSLNDQARIARVRDAMIEFEDLVSEDDLPGTWGFCFDNLVSNKHVPLSDDQTHHIIEGLETRLATFAARPNPGTTEITAAESAALRLEKYFKSEGDVEEANRVIRQYAKIVTASVDNLEPLVAHHWLRHLFDLLSSKGLNQDAAALTETLRSVGERTVEALSEISHEVSIPQEEVEEYLASFKGGTLDESLVRIAASFVPDPDHVLEQVKDLAQKAPLQALISHTVLDREGRAVAQVGSVEEDIEGRVIRQTSQNMQIEAFFLAGAIDAVVAHFSPHRDDLAAFLSRSPVFNEEMEPALKAGLSAYLGGDYLSSVCVLIPQIEVAVRNLAKLVGVPLFRPGRHGDLLLRNLDDLLRDEIITTIMGARMSSYLQLLLVDQRGWNLRNIVCHGLVPSSALGRGEADRVLHALLLISFIQKKDDA